MAYARVHSESFLFSHAVRSWLFAVRLGKLQGVPHDPEVVAVGTLLHDLGLTDGFTGPRPSRSREPTQLERSRGSKVSTMAACS
jgi:HD superfamily phosphodiesterase